MTNVGHGIAPIVARVQSAIAELGTGSAGRMMGSHHLYVAQVNTEALAISTPEVTGAAARVTGHLQDGIDAIRTPDLAIAHAHAAVGALGHLDRSFDAVDAARAADRSNSLQAWSDLRHDMLNDAWHPSGS